MAKTPEQIEQILKQQTSICQKVYDCVPIEEYWSAQQVYSEILRKNLSVEYRLVEGCLNSLKQAGLVYEAASTFRRVSVRNTERRKVAVAPVQVPVQVPVTPTSTRMSPLDRLGALAERLNRLTEEARQLANDLTDAAVEIQSQVEMSDEDRKKFSQLKNLLREINA